MPDQILNLGGGAVIPYLALLLDITTKNAIIQSDCKKPQWFAFTKGPIAGWSQITGQSV
jgi:hypothetical protein